MPYRYVMQKIPEQNGFHIVKEEVIENGMAIVIMLLIGKIMVRN